MHRGVGEAGRPQAWGLPKSSPSRPGPGKGAALPARPVAEISKPHVQLRTNYFGLTFTVESFTVYKYTFNVRNSSNKIFRRAEVNDDNIFGFVKGALHSVGAQPGEHATDYRHHIVSLKPLRIPKNKQRRLDDEGPGGWAIEFGDTTLQVQLGKSALNSPSPDVIDCLRLILGHSTQKENQIATTRLHKFYRGVDDPHSKNPSGGSGIPEAVSAVYREGLSLKEILEALKEKTGAGSTAWFIALTSLHRVIAKSRVLYKLSQKSSKKVRISGLARRDDRDSKSKDAAHALKIERDFPGSTDVKFWFKNEYRTVWGHFKKERNVDIAKDLPLINIGKPGRPEYVPAEYCIVLGSGRLDKLESLNKSTCQSPESKQIWFRPHHNLQELKPDSGPSRVLTNFHIIVHHKEPLKVIGRELDSPQISYCEKQPVIVSPDVSWKIAEKSLAKGPRTKKSWTWIYLGGDIQTGFPRSAENGVKQLDDTLKRMCAKGLPPRFVNNENHCIAENATAIRASLAYAKSCGVELVVVISPNRLSKDTYKHLKFFGDVQTGIHTSCILLNKFRKTGKDGQEGWNYGYFRNVAMKINLKLGGTSHMLEQDLVPTKKNGLIVMGYGTTDQSAEEIKEKQSQVGLVISADEKLGQWQSSCWNQDTKQEVTGTIFTERLENQLHTWHSINAFALDKPTLSVVIYRYGVSESQFDTVLKQEAPAIQKTFKKAFDGKPTKITLVVAIKGQATQFFPIEVKDGGLNRNIKPGTAVDSVVARPDYREFFLASHFASKGVPKPARYVVLLDGVFQEGDSNHPDPVESSRELERFTQDLCYVFGGATKAISICTPAHYVDSLCTRARAYKAAAAKDEIKREVEKSAKDPGEKRRILAGEVHKDLCNTMHWI
ncbi:hypothetical protein KVR01_000608 [Diaporthe batatas]|uniref:uncharacterized protein n=1 Tax=Diaporthe batatas TaxID=748121 RepID=UPI001D044369|nr:uncharacterized protein KVR01_000608 [Diaporthe batatas]KAG8169863.1 hypothetical protein KVR01_000608 [Diaporthe batatas]